MPRTINWQLLPVNTACKSWRSVRVGVHCSTEAFRATRCLVDAQASAGLCYAWWWWSACFSFRWKIDARFDTKVLHHHICQYEVLKQVAFHTFQLHFSKHYIICCDTPQVPWGLNHHRACAKCTNWRAKGLITVLLCKPRSLLFWICWKNALFSLVAKIMIAKKHVICWMIWLQKYHCEKKSGWLWHDGGVENKRLERTFSHRLFFSGLRRR